MTSTLTPAMRNFVEYFGALGPRWGLEADACRIHAFLYLSGRAVSGQAIADALDLKPQALDGGLRYLAVYSMIEEVPPASWRTGGDPWDMLMSGLEARRQREIGPALETLRSCHREARGDGTTDPATGERIGKMLQLVEDLAALDAQTRRLSPGLIRGLVGLSGRAARFMDRARRSDRGKES